jgi:chromate transport protein ChrA
MQRYLRITRMGLWLGSTVFGGLNAAYPVIRQRAAELGGITPEDVDGLYTLAVLLPGPSFLNLWGAVSARAGGWPGAVIGQIALLLPAFVLALLLPLTARIPWLQAHAAGALNGAVWGTAGLLLATGIEGLRKQKSAGLRVITGLSLVALLAGISPLLLLLAVLVWGVLAAYLPRWKEGRAA